MRDANATNGMAIAAILLPLRPEEPPRVGVTVTTVVLSIFELLTMDPIINYIIVQEKNLSP